MPRVQQEPLELNVYRVDGYPCLRLTGEGDPQGADRLEAACRELMLAGHHRMVVDARDVQFFDPDCARRLEEICQELQEEGGGMVLVDRSLPVERSLKLVGLDRCVPVAASIAEATRCLDLLE
ncbi:MAG: STAS domain-containing protein [Armatimonadota bacterium]